MRGASLSLVPYAITLLLGGALGWFVHHMVLLEMPSLAQPYVTNALRQSASALEREDVDAYAREIALAVEIGALDFIMARARGANAPLPPSSCAPSFQYPPDLGLPWGAPASIASCTVRMDSQGYAVVTVRGRSGYTAIQQSLSPFR